MKKLFFFRSSAPSDDSTEVSPSKTEKQDVTGQPFEGGLDNVAGSYYKSLSSKL